MNGFAIRPLPNCTNVSFAPTYFEYLLDTYQLEFTEVLKIYHGDGTFRSIDICFGQGDELHDIRSYRIAGTGELADLVDVDGGTEFVILLQVIVTHTDFTKVTRMVLRSCISKHFPANGSSSLSLHRLFFSRLYDPTHLVKVGSVVMLPTSETTTTGMLSVLANSTVAGRDVPTVLAGIGESSRHLN